ncbi:MAG TPA: hypothetical protein VFB34_01580 [Chloroflexota bacterium]|nr:hypothetical protein [Chloroflexota bacterium]
MPDRSSKDRPCDLPEAAAGDEDNVAGEAPRSEAEREQPAEPELSEEGRRRAAQALGRRGGLKGGKARAEKLTPERRREIARNAAKKRWEKG